MDGKKGGIGGKFSLAALMNSDTQAPAAPIPAAVIADPVQAADEITGQDCQPEKTPRRRRVKNIDKLSKRGLHLSDAVMMRLTLLSMERKQSLSQLANQILMANLPAYKIEKLAS